MPLLDSLRRLTTAIPYPVLAPQKQFPQKQFIEQSGKAGEGWETCEYPECGQLRPAHAARERRLLEGRFMCSSACWSSMLRRRVERELFAWKLDRRMIHRHRVPLGLLLLSMGWITKEQLDAALQAQREAKEGRIGDWLRRQTALPEKELTRALAMQWNCPVFDLEEYRPQPVEIPRELLESYRILLLPARGRSVLFLAFDGGVDTVASYAIQHVTGMRVEAGMAGEDAFSRAWTRSLALQSGASETAPVQTSDDLYDAAASVLRAPDVADARLVRLHQHVWLRAILHAREEPGGSAKYRDYLYLLPGRTPVSPEETQ